MRVGRGWRARGGRVGGARALVSGALLCALAAGCTTADDERNAAPSPTPVTSSSTPPEPVTLEVAVYGEPGHVAAYEHLAKSFSGDFPHVTVEVEEYDDAAEVVAEVQGEDPPDVFLMDHTRLPGVVEDGLVEPVDTLLEARQVDFGDGYQRGGLTAFAAEARLQCMPHDVSPHVVYYNEDLVDLSRLGAEGEEPPSALDGWTWETFADAARRASRGRTTGVWVEPSLTALAPFVWSAGGEIVDDPYAPTTLTLAADEPRAALEQVLALLRDPRVTPAGVQMERDTAVQRFEDGRLAMILGPRALTPRFRAADVDFDVMPLPSLGRFRTVAEMTGYCISAETEALGAAGDFVAFAVSREGAAITTRDGYVVPSNLEVANSAVFLQESRQPSNAFIFNEGVRRTQALPFTPAWPELNAAVAPTLDRMFHAPVIDLEAVLTELDTASAAVLAPEEPEQPEGTDEPEQPGSPQPEETDTP